MASPRREPGRTGDRAVGQPHRTRPAQRRGGRSSHRRCLGRPRLGLAPVGHDGQRHAPGRDQRLALAARRLRDRHTDRATGQCAAQVRRQGEADEDAPAAAHRDRSPDGRTAASTSGALGAALSLAGLAFRDDMFVFSPAPDASSPYGPRSLSNRYRRLAIKLGLRSTRLHSLRHYAATELIAAGVDVRTVAGRLGHGSGGATTLKVYAGWVDEADRRAATTMAGIMPVPVAAPRAPRGPYEVIAAELREQIVTGRLRAGDQLPTIADLATRHGVAVGTVHRAMDLLRTEGLIAASRGRRSVVLSTAH